MKHTIRLLMLTAASLGMSGLVSAHTVSLSWDVQANGDVLFYDQHWHGSLGTPSGSLFVDGVEHGFTEVLNDTNSISGLDGALVNPSYASFDGDTLTALSDPNFLTVTVSGLQPGDHTFATTNIPLTQWRIPESDGSIDVTLPPPPTGTVPEPGALTMLGLGLAMLGLGRRKTRSA